MGPKAAWATDSEAMRASRIIVLVKSNQLVKISKLQLVKARLKSFFAVKKPALFSTGGL